MASATNNTTDGGGDGGGGVVVAAGGGEGGRRGSSSSTMPACPVPEWGGEAVSLKDFPSQRKVPGFARVTKGSYMTIGASRFSLQKQHHDVFVHSVKVGVKVLAHCVKRVEAQSHRRGGETVARLCAMDQRLTVPMTYQGWFELLTEDGKSARPITSVPELAKVFPSRCLVRENTKGYLTTGEGRLTFDKTKIVPAGEQLKLCGELSLPSPSEGLKVKLLHCVDTKGESVYLSFNQKGLFTPIAEENDFTGVFNIRDIIRRFRLPLTVKLIHGVRPRVPESKFSGLIRLDWVYTEETAFVCPLEKNHVRLLPVPCDVSLQLVAASNQEELDHSDMFRSIQAKCARMVNNYNNTLHLIVSLPDSVVKNQTQASRDSNVFSTALLPSSEGGPGRMRRSKSREDLLMDEIDDLYAYVRDGGVPPKPRFQYDSDEESYWEEPAYEPLDEFRARLRAMETGQKVNFPDHYHPADPTQLKSLVGEDGDAVVSSPAAGGAVGRAAEGLAAEALTDEPSTPAASSRPPPLPPRPADAGLPAAGRPCPQITTGRTTATAHPPVSPAADAGPQKPVLSRRASAPAPPSLSKVSADPLNGGSVNAHAKHPALTEDPAKTPPSGDAPEIPKRRTLRSGSVPTVSVPKTSAASSSGQVAVQQPQHPADSKAGWKERLRQSSVVPDKHRETSSSASSGSGQTKTDHRMAKDFRDSDISSQTKASSSSSGERSARKRMQTLYL